MVASNQRKTTPGVIQGCRLAAAALVFVAAIDVHPASAAAITAPFVTVGVGDIFTIDIAIDDAVDLTSWQFDLAFNPAIVEVNLVTEGPFMSSFGMTLFVPGIIDNTSGLISLVSAFYVDFPPNPSGDGVLANVEFQALAVGVSPLHFSNVFLNALDQGFDISDGQITVTDPSGGGTPVPEPTTLILLSSGIASMAFRVRVRRDRRSTTDARWHSRKDEQ